MGPLWSSKHSIYSVVNPSIVQIPRLWKEKPRVEKCTLQAVHFVTIKSHSSVQCSHPHAGTRAAICSKSIIMFFIRGRFVNLSRAEATEKAASGLWGCGRLSRRCDSFTQKPTRCLWMQRGRNHLGFHFFSPSA